MTAQCVEIAERSLACTEGVFSERLAPPALAQLAGLLVARERVVRAPLAVLGHVVVRRVPGVRADGDRDERHGRPPLGPRGGGRELARARMCLHMLLLVRYSLFSSVYELLWRSVVRANSCGSRELGRPSGSRRHLIQN